jgi:MoxR-like ATPase
LFIRVQINPETDEDDLLGGFRLIDGETVFSKGPVLKAMENGAILLLDEIDRATNKIMCLQGILEGKPVLVKKTGEIVEPAEGFNVIATANTKGKGSEDGRFTAASIIDDAFLERFTISVDQQFPSLNIEKKIVIKHMEKFNCIDMDFAEKLVLWADIIRKTFYDDGVDEVISTRRLCHIVQTFSIFEKRDKAIDLCISRKASLVSESNLEIHKSIALSLFSKIENV